jgi:hypothetical protein
MCKFIYFRLRHRSCDACNDVFLLRKGRASYSDVRNGVLFYPRVRNCHFSTFGYSNTSKISILFYYSQRRGIPVNIEYLYNIVSSCVSSCLVLLGVNAVITSAKKYFFFDRIRNKIIHEMLYDDSSESSEEAEATNFFTLSFLEALEMSDTNFLLHFLIPKESFMILSEDIKDYQEFQQQQGRYGNLYRPKAPLKNQLLVFLYVLGAVGSDANYKKVASRFKISHGSVQIFVERCTRAIISAFQSEVLSWPDAVEGKIISKRFQEKYGFANCVGLMD